MRKFLTFSLTLLFLSSATPAYAHPWVYHVGEHARAHGDQENTGTSRPSSTENKETKKRGEELRGKVDEFKAASKERRATVAKEVCTKMVDHRTKAVEEVKTRISASDLTTEQKNDLTKTADDVLAKLATYKTECSSATTEEQFKEIAKKIRELRVFHWILPRAHALRAINKGEAFTGRLNNHTATIQKHIDEAKAKGCATANAEAALAEYKEAIADAQEHLSSAKNIVVAVGPTGDPGESKREQVKSEMEKMKNALKKARDAHKKIIVALKECRTTTKSSTPSTTPITPPSTTPATP